LYNDTKEVAMSATAVSSNPALIVIDLQKGLLKYPTVHPVAEVVANAAALAKAFRSQGHPVVLVSVVGGTRGPGLQPDWAEPADELDAQDGDLRISKERWGAFHNTELDAQLRERAVTQVVVCGIATSMGVETTARCAYEHGYRVVLATDATSDFDAEAHDHCVRKVFPRLGEVDESSRIIAMTGK
jgi:nicotinamidase-related amidase